MYILKIIISTIVITDFCNDINYRIKYLFHFDSKIYKKKYNMLYIFKYIIYKTDRRINI